MGAFEAVEDALRDMRVHEVATVAAMRSAVGALISRFDPTKLRVAAERGGLNVPLQRKARAWDEFVALYEQTNLALTDDFDSVFGKAFARAYERSGQPDSALALYERSVNTNGLGLLFDQATTLAPTYRRLGELYEDRGQLDKARDYYGRFIDLWKNADPELQPLVRDVRQRLVRLTAEGAK